jgi:hypothetical protein
METTLSRYKSLTEIFGIIATCWREATGLVVLKVAMVFFASTYRGPHALPAEQIRQTLAQYFEADTAGFLSSLEPVFLFLLLGTLLSMPFVVLMFGALGPRPQGHDERQRSVLVDFSILAGAVLACELVAGFVATLFVVMVVPDVTFALTLQRQALVAFVALVSVVPLVSAMVLLRTVARRRIPVLALGLLFILGARYGTRAVVSIVPAYRWISQHHLESLLMTGEADRLALGGFAAATWAALFLGIAFYVVRRSGSRVVGASRVGGVVRTSP